MQNKTNTLKIDEILEELHYLRDRNEELESELTHFKARSLAMAQRCRDLSRENMKIESELADLRFTKNFLNVEDTVFVEAENTFLGDDF